MNSTMDFFILWWTVPKWLSHKNKAIKKGPFNIARDKKYESYKLCVAIVFALPSQLNLFSSLGSFFTVRQNVRGAYKHFSISPLELTISHRSVHWVSARDRKHFLQSASSAGRGTKTKRREKHLFIQHPIPSLSFHPSFHLELTKVLITQPSQQACVTGEINLETDPWHLLCNLLGGQFLNIHLSRERETKGFPL